MSTPTGSDSPATHVGATTVNVRKASSGSENTETKHAARRSKSYPADLTDSGEEESSFERQPSLRQKLFGSRGRKTPEGSKGSETCSSETLTQSNDSLSSSKSGKQNDSSKSKRGKSGKSHDSTNSKDGKPSKRKTLMGRFSSSRPLSVVEVTDKTPKQNVHQRTKSDASVVKKRIDIGSTSPSTQAGNGLENSPSVSSYHTVVSLNYQSTTSIAMDHSSIRQTFELGKLITNH